MSQSGWNRQGSKPVVPVKKGGAWKRGLVCGLVVVAGAVAAWFALSPSGEVAEKPEKDAPKKIKEVKPAAAPKAEPAPLKPHKLTREEALFAKTNGWKKAPGKMLTEDGRELTFPVPKPGEFRIVHTHGKMYKCDSEGNFVDITPKPIFDNSFEECLVGMAVEGGSFIPGMLMGYDEAEVRSMLTKVVSISPDDPPDVVEKKEAVAFLKADMLDYMNKGGKFDNYVMEMRKQSVHERGLKSQAMKDIVGMLKKGDNATAAAYCDKVNELFNKQGMKPLKLPSHINSILDDARAAGANNQ